ncbi:hypothetical protein RJ639_031860 [Escallonia herrerae]|uniref:Biogenesis of lysosome-related organelles complex 1 subunit 1 n=1 Tax=Escallonia herrerae TaxID=1293975 RepID=A0AA89B3I9_9ASTE|nr:hypothetical protein RJ639_043277 [Escallonia herrerae]KAK3037819.1 hypothetical protein RJ639_031860 [Escallonia herrerae]
MYSPQLQAARARVLFPSQTEQLNVETGTLEASLLQLMSDHHHTSLRLHEHTGADTGYVIFQTEKAKKNAIIAAMRVSDLLVDTVNGGVQESFEIGDFENWMKTMEFDCKSITTAICKIHQA